MSKSISNYIDLNSQKRYENRHLAVFGSSGSGKTVSVCEQMLRTMCEEGEDAPPHSLMLTDGKGRLSKKYKARLEAAGYEVHILDFIHPELSETSYNPLAYVRPATNTSCGYNQQDLLAISQALCPDPKDGREKFWSGSARNVITAVNALVLEKLIPEQRHFGSALDILPIIGTERGKKIYHDLDVESDHSSFAARTYQLFDNVTSVNVTWGGIYQHVTEAFSLFDFDGARHMFCQPVNFRIEELGRRKCVLFVQVSDNDPTLGKIINLFYTQSLQALISEADSHEDGLLEVPVRCVYDDFSSCQVEGFENTISICRSRGIDVTILLQTYTQLVATYGEAKAGVIIGNFDHMIFLGGMDPATVHLIATRAGRTPEDIMNMPFTKAWVFNRSERPRLVDKIDPFAE